MASDDLQRRFLEEFTAEATEHLDTAEAALVAFDTSGFDTAGQAEIMRAMHTIKGGAGYLTLTGIQDLAHAIETAVKRLDQTPLAGSGRLEVLFEAFDTLRELLARPTDPGGVPEALLEALQVSQEEAQLSPAATNGTIDNALENVMRQQCQALSAAAGRFALDKDDTTAQAMLRRVLATVRSAATYAGDDGLLEAIEDIDQSPARDAARCEALRLRLKRILEPPCANGRTSQTQPVDAGEPRRGADQGSSAAFQGQFLRVSSDHVDALVRQAGEMLTLRNQLQHFLRSLEAEGCADHLCRTGKGLALGLGKAVDELQNVSLELRLIQLSSIFQRLPRVARDVAQRTGKRTRLHIEGGETGIDKSVAEVIADPLVHMVRNAIDHGIEPPEEREAIGKEAEGLVEVRAAREGNDIVISVRDDGRGVDPDAVRSTAVARGIVAEAAAADLSLDGIYDLLFLPGFSTASTVTEISGRGVGLDVVRANVRSAGGDVSIRSEAGSFTIIEMRLPVRVSARDVLLVEAANEWYGIPLDTVRRTLSMPSAGLQTIAGTPAIVHDEQVVPLLSLAELLGQAHHRARPEWLDVVVLDSRSQTGALLVDAIGQRYQLTVKPLDPYLATPGVDGAAILADGRVVLVLDPEPLMNALEERSCNRSSPWSSSRS